MNNSEEVIARLESRLAASQEIAKKYEDRYFRAMEDHAMCVTRWKESLENPIPAPGVMPEPAESLYRRTEQLRVELDQARAENARLKEMLAK